MNTTDLERVDEDEVMEFLEHDDGIKTIAEKESKAERAYSRTKVANVFIVKLVHLTLL